MERVLYFSRVAPRDPDDVSSVVGNLRNLGPNSYLIVNRAQAAYLQLTYSYAPDWGERLRANLDARSDLTRVFATRDVAVYTLASTVTDRPERAPAYPGFSLVTTPSTPLGIAVTIAADRGAGGPGGAADTPPRERSCPAGPLDPGGVRAARGMGRGRARAVRVLVVTDRSQSP